MGEMIIISFGVYLLSLIFAVSIKPFLYLYFYLLNLTAYNEKLMYSSILLNSFALAMLFLYFYKKFKEKRSNKKPDTSSFLYISKEFIKAKYHKYCPKIEWYK